MGDQADEIRRALDEERAHSRLIILTGGLGPTADDITKPLLCEYFSGRMIVDQKVREHVIYLFEKVYRRPGPILERNLKQAEVPDVARVLHNARGSAPGMLFEKEGVVFVSLPGVPHEMKGILVEEVLPLLPGYFELQAIVHRTAFTAGQGESMIAERLIDFESSLPAHIKLAYLPSYGMVKLRLTSAGADRQQLETEVDGYFQQLLTLVKPFLVSDQDEGLERVIGRLLTVRGQSLGTAESCTGGYIAHLITSIPGSSAYFKGSVVSYANAVKEQLLHVPHDIIASNGAVSEATVRAMVAGALDALDCDYALATSGIMGPGGGSEEKPVGTVWIAVGNRTQTQAIQLQLRFDRQRNIHITAGQALNFLRKFILTNS